MPVTSSADPNICYRPRDVSMAASPVRSYQFLLHKIIKCPPHCCEVSPRDGPMAASPARSSHCLFSVEEDLSFSNHFHCLFLGEEDLLFSNHSQSNLNEIAIQLSSIKSCHQTVHSPSGCINPSFLNPVFLCYSFQSSCSNCPFSIQFLKTIPFQSHLPHLRGRTNCLSMRTSNHLVASLVRVEPIASFEVFQSPGRLPCEGRTNCISLRTLIKMYPVLVNLLSHQNL